MNVVDTDVSQLNTQVQLVFDAENHLHDPDRATK